MNGINSNKENVRIIQDTLRGGIKRKVLYSDEMELGWLENIEITDKDIRAQYESAYAERYFEGEKADIAKNFENFLPLQDKRIQQIKEFIKPDDSLLEIGSGPGYFLKAVSELCTSTKGLELNKAESEFARSIGIDVQTGATEDLPSDARYNHICLFQVLEHQPDPVNFLLEVKKLLMNEKSFIHIELPTLNNPLVSLYDIPSFRDFWFQEPHLFYFKLESIEEIARAAGMKVAKNELSQSTGLVNHISWMLTNKPMSHRKFAVSPVPPFNINTDISDNDAFEMKNRMDDFFEDVNSRYIKMLEEMGFGDVLSCTLVQE